MAMSTGSMRMRLVAVGLVGGAVVLPFLTSSPAGAATGTAPAVETTTRCTKGVWPAEAAGRPTMLEAGAAAGVYVWHEADGWRIAVTHPGQERVTFTARVAVDTRLAAVETLTERPDLVWTRRQRSVLEARFTNYGQLDAVRVVTDCAGRIVIDAKIDGVRVTPDQVYVGADGAHPNAVPMIAVRR